MTTDTEIRTYEGIEEEFCPSCKSEDLHTFHDPVLSIAHMTCNVCGANWQEETTSWAEQDALKLSDQQIADLGAETDPKMIPCGCSENISKYDCKRFGCLRETL